MLIARVGVGPRPNALAYDTRRRHLFSFNLGEPAGTNCTASVVSVDDHRIVATLDLPGRPRWAVFDERTRSVYANIGDPPLIAVIDADALAIARSIPVPAVGPHGLALVVENGVAALWCAADGGQLAILDPDSGSVQAALPLPGVPDVVMFEKELARLYVAVGSPGTVSVFDTRRRVQLETITTEDGAHTIGWDTATRRLFVFQPLSCGVAIYEDAA